MLDEVRHIEKIWQRYGQENLFIVMKFEVDLIRMFIFKSETS